MSLNGFKKKPKKDAPRTKVQAMLVEQDLVVNLHINISLKGRTPHSLSTAVLGAFVGAQKPLQQMVQALLSKEGY